MIGKTNVGGGVGVTAWAYIGVTYPEGSTCTATNGTITLSADGTSGKYVFGVPEPLSTPETWTVSCTNGVKTKSAEVELSEQYSFAIVTLRYSRLPEGYQEVEYLESSGSQYFNLGMFANLNTTEITLDFMLLEYAQARAVLGTDNNSTNIVYIGRPEGNSAPFNYSYWYESLRSGTAVINERALAVVNNNNGEITENGITVGYINMSYNLNTRLYLFGVATNALVKARVYSFAMRNKTTDTLIYNYVPCYRESDSVAGFYDLANNEFVIGTGTFIVGADV